MSESNWQPIETAPKSRNWIIATDTRHGNIIYKARYEVNGFVGSWINRKEEQCFPEYWTPMPKAYPLEKTPNPYANK